MDDFATPRNSPQHSVNLTPRGAVGTAVAFTGTTVSLSSAQSVLSLRVLKTSPREMSRARTGGVRRVTADP